MGHAYTPGLRVTEATVLRKERRLPLPGEVRVGVGQEVAAWEVVAATNLPGNVTTVNVARELNIQPEAVPGRMLKREGETVSPGETIAETRALWGLFHAAARSTLSGTIEAISPVTGQVLVRGEPVPVTLEAYVAGTVVEVLGNEGVVVESECAYLQGIVGLGGETYGALEMRAESPQSVLDGASLDASCADKVVVGGSLVTLAALERAVEVGARGIVVGGIGDRDLDTFLGYPLGVAVTGNEKKGLTVVITEGFGKMNMARRSFELLKARAGHGASISGATQIRAGVIRPEVIIPHQAGDAGGILRQSSGAGLAPGAPVRMIRDPYFGALATVVELPEELRQIETEAKVRVLIAELEDGQRVEVPRANVELLES